MLLQQQAASFTLIYGNRTWKQTMFAEQIMDLKDRFKERFQLINVFSREMNDSALLMVGLMLKNCNYYLKQI